MSFEHVKDSKESEGSDPLSNISSPPLPGALRMMHVRNPHDITVLQVNEPGAMTQCEPRNQIALKNLEEALAHLECSQKSDHFRKRIRLLLACTSKNTEQEIMNFLRSVKSISQRPYTVVGSPVASTVSQEIADVSILYDGEDPTGIARSLLPKVREHWEENGTQEEVDLIPFKRAKFSPLPSLRISHLDPEKDSYNLLETDCEGIYWLAMIDLDNTLYKPASPFTIMLHHFARFMKVNHPREFRWGNALDDLISYCDKWEAQRKLVDKLRSQGRDSVSEEDLKVIQHPLTLYTTYEEGITVSGKKSAAAFEGMPIEVLRKYGKEFISAEFKRRTFDYGPIILQKIKDHGVLPYLVTGAPDFLVPAILKELNMTHGHGMTYGVNHEGRLTGYIENNMGLSEKKAELGKLLVKRCHKAIALTIGDHFGDMGSARCAVDRNAKWDVNGGFVLVNGTPDVIAEVRRHYSNDMPKKTFERWELRWGWEEEETELEREEGEKRVHVVPAKAPSPQVSSAVALALRAVFDPLHKYANLQALTDYPTELKRYLEELELPRPPGKPIIDNIENLKRIRDVLEREGLPKTDIQLIMEEFYPPVIVKQVVKRNVINTEVPLDLEEYLERIGVSRNALKEVMECSSDYHAKHGSMAPATPKKRSSAPPPRPPAKGENNGTF